MQLGLRITGTLVRSACLCRLPYFVYANYTSCIVSAPAQMNIAMQGNIRACRDSKRRMERAAADYDAASKRYLGLGKRWRSDSGDKGEKARVDMMQAEASCHLQQLLGPVWHSVLPH